jgi:protein-tyrosine phosphatase
MIDKYGTLLMEPSINQICSKIYLGNYDTAFYKLYLKSLGITHILVCGTDLKELYQNDFVYLKLDIEDASNQEIRSYFEQTNKFIEGAEKVYVHCRAGRSRSPAIVIAYLMEKLILNSTAVLKFVFEKRRVYPNSNFKEQLRLYTYELMKKHLFSNLFEEKDLEKIII